MNKQSGGGGNSTPPNTPPSKPGAASQEAAMARARSQVDSQAPDAGRQLHAAQQQAANSPQENRGGSPDSPGKTADKNAPNQTQTQTVANAGQAMQRNEVQSDGAGHVTPGVGRETTNAQPQEQAKVQSSLDNAGKNGQNGPQEGSKYGAAREQAKEAPKQENDSPSIDK